MTKLIYIAAIAVAGLLPTGAFASFGVDADVSVRADVRTDAHAPSQPAADANGAVICTKEARVCPDGSTVGRVGPKCEFAACPAPSSEGERSMAKPARERSKALSFSLEATTNPAFSVVQLKQSIEARKKVLDAEVASTTGKERDVLKDANPVRVAVHTLLASRELLGGIGPQVSQIARSMNDSLATTTSVEMELKSRGFLMRLLFGGDRDAAERLQEQIDRNQERIDALTALLSRASLSAELRTTLEAQVKALEEAHVRLEAIADKEDGAWGLLSWRVGTR